MIKLVISGSRQGYGIEDCKKSYTVGELIAELENYDKDMDVVFSDGDLYSRISCIEEECYSEEEEEE